MFYKVWILYLNLNIWHCKKIQQTFSYSKKNCLIYFLCSLLLLIEAVEYIPFICVFLKELKLTDCIEISNITVKLYLFIKKNNNIYQMLAQIDKTFYKNISFKKTLVIILNIWFNTGCLMLWIWNRRDSLESNSVQILKILSYLETFNMELLIAFTLIYMSLELDALYKNLQNLHKTSEKKIIEKLSFCITEHQHILR